MSRQGVALLRLDFVLTSPQTKPTTCVHSFSRDLWAGLRRATAVGIYDLTTFDKTEYFYYDNPVNGDLHEVVPGKFIAFKGPKDADFRDSPCDMVDMRLSVLCRVHAARTRAHPAHCRACLQARTVGFDRMRSRPSFTQPVH